MYRFRFPMALPNHSGIVTFFSGFWNPAKYRFSEKTDNLFIFNALETFSVPGQG